MFNGEWWYNRRELIKELISGSTDEVLTNFLKDEKDKMCQKCAHWDHANAGHYDSGQMATCKHPKMYGRHHPSNGCGMTELTMTYVPYTLDHHGDGVQEIMTRWNFYCGLWERRERKNENN